MRSIRASIRYGITSSPFGQCLIASSDRGILRLSFLTTGTETAVIQELKKARPLATLKRDDSQASRQASTLFDFSTINPALDIEGSDFQLAVWQSLMTITPGTTISYGQLATIAGFPKAHRAVGTAVGNNPVAFLIPCHRVIRADGSLGHYRWGQDLKRNILEWEHPSSLS